MAISASTTYELLPLEDVNLAVEVPWNSTANMADVRLYSRNDSNAQKWMFEATGTSNVWYIKDAETGKCLEVYGAAQNDRDGANVSMWTANQGTEQRWKADRIGSQAVNGTNYETYQFTAFGGTTATPRCIDVQGDGAYINSNIAIWSKVAGHPSQTFALVPTEWNAIGGTGNDQAVLPTPTGGTCGTTAGTALPKVCGVDSGTVYPAWKCPEAKYQVRYRTRTRTASTGALAAWTNWKSISNSATTFNGWGTVGAANCTPTAVGGLMWSPNGVAVDNSSTYDRTDIEFDARAWRSDWGVGSTASAHGGDASWTVSTVRAAAISSVTVLLAPDGLTVGWETTGTAQNAITIESPAWGTRTLTGGASGSTGIPHQELNYLPSYGDTETVTMTMQTADGLVVTKTVSATVGYDGSHGTSISLTSSVNGTIATLTCNKAAAKAWMVVNEGHIVRYVPLTGATPWTCAPPIGVPWSVLATVENASGWASKLFTFAAVDDAGIHVTSQDLSRDLAIYGNVKVSPSATPNYSRNTDAVDVSGRDRPVYAVHRPVEQTFTVTGAIYGENVSEARRSVDWAQHAEHVILRTPDGTWAQACVTGGGIVRVSDDAYTVSLSLKGESW